MIDKYLREILKDKPKHIITIECTEQAANETLIPLLEYIKTNAGPGHSFEIIVDPDMRENRESFFMDGDGNAYIHSIKCIETIKDNK